MRTLLVVTLVVIGFGVCLATISVIGLAVVIVVNALVSLVSEIRWRVYLQRRTRTIAPDPLTLVAVAARVDLEN